MVGKVKSKRVQNLSQKREVYFIYLPKEWIEMWNLDKNRDVTVVYDKELVVIPKLLLKPKLCKYCVFDQFNHPVCIYNIDAPGDCSDEFCPLKGGEG
jgi:hypothetical protein